MQSRPLSRAAIAIAVAGFGCGRLDFDDSLTLVATYPLDEASGQIAHNSVPGGSALDGVLGESTAVESTDPTWVPGRHGSALSFDAIDDLVEVPSSDISVFATTTVHDAITISAWFQPADPGSAYQAIYQIGGESNGATLGVIPGGNVRFALRNKFVAQVSKVLDTTMILNAGTWYYLAGTSDASGMRLYVYADAGQLLELATSPGPYQWNTGTDGIALGNNPADDSGLRGLLSSGPEPCNGIVDEVRIYTSAIAQAQIESDLRTPPP
ncbi:MAG TPA: LamG domain-containing protein [Kofleriaceae bacterium]|nr:LamG domain-containing protein [Kofleriaceae bacterium]